MTVRLNPILAFETDTDPPIPKSGDVQLLRAVRPTQDCLGKDTARTKGHNIISSSADLDLLLIKELCPIRIQVLLPAGLDVCRENGFNWYSR